MSKERIFLRPFRKSDEAQLDLFREGYYQADLEVPHGYECEGEALETVIAEKAGETVLSLTGTLSLTLDPLVKNPEASVLEVMEALRMAEQALSVMGRKSRAVDVYIAVPNQMTDYHDLLRKYGYRPTVQGCTVFRRPLIPDTKPLLGDARDKVLEHVVE